MKIKLLVLSLFFIIQEGICQTEFDEVQVGDILNDNWLRLKQATSDGYGFDFQYDNASVIVNEQGVINQALILGDVDGDQKQVLFGIGHKTSTTSWLQKMSLSGSGRLSLGSHQPESNLDIRSEGNTSIILKSTTVNAKASLFMGEQGNSTDLKRYGFEFDYEGEGSNNFVLKRYNNSNTSVDVLRVDRNTGNISIGDHGDISPDNLLEVSGTIRSKEVKVETINWPDYVFFDSYKLRSLEETSTYIKQNGHLPGIPSAAEVVTDGINLGEMNALLLKKIEELTLHLIEKDRDIDNLKEENKRFDALEARMNAIENNHE